MIIDVIPSLKEIVPQKIYGKTVIILDIFRCTSTIVTALTNGCNEIIPAQSPEEALEIADKMSPGTFVVAGEIKGERIGDFQLGNSPLDFTADRIAGKTIILTTTNGTKAIKACKPAKNVLIGSFLNAAAVTTCAAGYAKDVVIVCAGRSGSIALEDVMGAGFLLSEIKKSIEDIRLTEVAKTFYYLFQHFKNHLSPLLHTTRSGMNLKNIGYISDIEFCLKENIYKVIPYYKHNSIQPIRSIKV